MFSSASSIPFQYSTLMSSGALMVGGADSYEARCRACHKIAPADEAQGRLI